MEGSRDPSGRNASILPLPRASASGLSPGLESPGPWAGGAGHPTNQGNSDPAGWRKTSSPSTRSGLNPSIQIRAVPTITPFEGIVADTTTPRSLNPSIQIRAVPAGPGALRNMRDPLRVSIPPYRSGQFRPYTFQGLE